MVVTLRRKNPAGWARLGSDRGEGSDPSAGSSAWAWASPQRSDHTSDTLRATSPPGIPPTLTFPLPSRARAGRAAGVPNPSRTHPQRWRNSPRRKMTPKALNQVTTGFSWSDVGGFQNQQPARRDPCLPGACVHTRTRRHPRLSRAPRFFFFFPCVTAF